jgi:hypothetical protein
MDSASAATSSSFSLGFRITVAVGSLISGFLLSLWASQETELWKWWPAVFCFAIAGTVALPKFLAVTCGYFVAATIVVMSLWFLYLGVTGKDSFLKAARFGEVFGLPAAAFLIYRTIPRRK